MQCVTFIFLFLLVGLFTPWPELLGISALDLADILPDKCKLRKKVGKCKAIYLRFFFNTKTLKCEEFTYGGCGGNANNFENEEECHDECGYLDSLPDICKLPQKVGRCKASHPRFFFNTTSLQCEEFIYGGCGGNANRFITEVDCLHQCGPFAYVPDVCKLPVKLGKCAIPYQYYFFNIKTMKCEQLPTAGCIMNKNYFMTEGGCNARCIAKF